MDSPQEGKKDYTDEEILDMIEKAYEKTGLAPTAYSFYPDDTNACPMGVLGLCAGDFNYRPSDLEDNYNEQILESSFTDSASEILGKSKNWIHSFIYGFDGSTAAPTRGGEYCFWYDKDGHRVGMEARRRFLGRVEPYKEEDHADPSK